MHISNFNKCCQVLCSFTSTISTLYILFYRFNFLFEKQSCREEERHRESFSLQKFTPQMHTVARDRLDQTQELRASYGSPTWMQCSKDLWCPLLLSQSTSGGAGWVVEKLGHEPVAVWDPCTCRQRTSATRLTYQAVNFNSVEQILGIKSVVKH